MASLTGQQINLTYEGLIKTADNTATVPFPPVALQYGNGTDTPISLGDGTGVGVGQITLIEGTPGVLGGGVLEVNGIGVSIGKLASIDNQGTSSVIWNGTYTFGQGFPGAPATNIDFTNATVTGLPSAAGLENGTGTDSLQSAASLTTNAADASGNYSIALGDGASATRQESVAIGQNATANGTGSDGSIAIGNGAVAGSNRAVVIGVNNSSTSSEGIAIGDNVDIAADRSIGLGNAINIAAGATDVVAIGTEASVDALRGIAIGQNADAQVGQSIAIGYSTRAYGNAASVAIGDDADGHNGGVGIGDGAQAYYGSVAIGKGASSTFTTFGNVHIGENAKNTTGGNGANVTIGVDAQQTNNAEYAIAVGYGSTVSANNAVALGANVTAATADTVSLKALEVQTDSTPTAGGIIISDAGSTDRRINITSAGIPQIDSDPMLVNDSTTNTDMTKVWSGTEAQYNALGAYDANTLYYLT